ncbi:MAG: hypothetical protein M0P16_11025 [Syntrophales bacterium]|nr:hypothetical protein [Syntrophales bacterium]MCK9392532.1 hypothetical protein [Syntrophales bacterium]
MNKNPPPRRVLFLGNSHIYTHDIPKLISGLVKTAGRWNDLHSETSTASGVSLEWHWHNPRSRDLITQGPWDYVVLQERSGGPLEDPAKMFQNARLLDGEIRKTSGKTAFYMTWANQNRRDSQQVIAEAYDKISRELGATLVPVGCAWENALSANSHISLHGADGRHANPIGAYLTACVFYGVIYGTTPEGLPGTLSDQGVVLIDLPTALARFLQRIAYQTVSNP